MAEQWQIDLALMAGAAYRTSRTNENTLPIPAGWEKTSRWHVTNPSYSGFEAVSFKKGDDIVIAFAGTFPKDIHDVTTDLALGLGNFDHRDSGTPLKY